MASRLFFAGIIVLLIFLGCGGGGGGGSGLSPVGPSAVASRLFGTIEIDQAVSAIRPETGSFSASLRFLNSFITLEEPPNLSTRADADGRYFFENITFGNYHLLAKVTSLAGREYKIRTSPVIISQTEPIKEMTLRFAPLDLAEYQIRMQVKDLNGNPVGKCKIWFWGELFTLENSGYYISPFMPAGAAGTLKVEPPADKELSRLEFYLPETTFQPDNIAITGVTLPTAGIVNKAPVVGISTGKLPAGSIAFLRLYGKASDPEGEPLVTKWQANVSTFSYIAPGYADWAVPSTAASVTIYFSASEDGRSYPRLTSTAQLTVTVASSGVIGFPGEVLLPPVTRTVDIIGTATTQIAGNMVARYEARPDFPQGLTLTYNWSVDKGTIISDTSGAILTWKSPILSSGLTQLATINLTVSDGIATATRQLLIKVTSAPLVVIDQPTADAFEPGPVAFAGSARDYLNTAIAPEFLRWYVATGTAEFALQKTGANTFSYKFVSQGSYTVALECTDSNGVIGTGTKTISIINSRPVCVITTPANDASYQKNTPVTFAGTATDFEDGLITDATALSWVSNIDGKVGSGSVTTAASLSSGMHVITFSASDSAGAIGSTSIVIWYDVPARISLTPANLSVFFAGDSITFNASGTDTDHTPLDVTQFKWYLDNLPEIWQEGQTFTRASGSMVPGIHSVRVEGAGRFGTVISPIHAIQVGWPVASITSPAVGNRFEPGSSVSFAAVPDSTGTLILQWFLNNEPNSFGSGANVSYTPVNGAHHVTYIGTDSMGFVSSSSVDFIVERIPVVSFQPGNGSYLFGGRSVAFNAICIDTNNNDIPDNKVSWLLDGNSWKTGKSFTVNQGIQPSQLAAGLHQVRLTAVGPYGTIGTITNNITSGITVAKINSPSNNATFNTGSNITFSGVPDSIGAITMQWWANYGTVGAIHIGDGETVNTSTLPAGYHQITYLGTDSAGFASSNSINVSVGEYPLMDFTPADGSIFFAGQDVTFIGVGTDTSNGTSILGSKMAWYVDGNLELASYSVFPMTVARVGQLGAGNKQVVLRGTNSINAVGMVSKNIYLGLQNASITWPVQDTVIPRSTLFNFTGAPDTTGTITMQWWLNYGLPGATLLGSGQSINATLPDGWQYLTYIGTDSAGVVSSATIRVTVSDSPAISFTPSHGSRLFSGQPFNLAIGGVIEPATVKWYLDGSSSAWKTVSPAVVAAGDLSVGSHQITAEGANPLGVMASITNTIYYGESLATITSPASGSNFAIGASVNFAGLPVSVNPIAMQWYRDDGSGAVFMGNVANLSASPPPGRHTITYIGTDSANFVSSASIQILLNDPPPMEITPGDNAMFFAGRSVNFTGSGTSVINGLPVDSATMQWYLDGFLSKTGSAVTYTVAEQAPPGFHTLRLEGTDEFATVGSSTLIDVKFGHTTASISSPASGSRYDVGQLVTLSGLPDSEGMITMEWYRDGDPVAFATGANPAGQIFPAGMQTIRYRGTDSSGFISSAAIQILVNGIPAMEIIPGDNSIFFAGNPVNMIGSGTTSSGQPVATATMKWYVDGAAVHSYTGSPISIGATALPAGPHTMKVEGTDEYGIKGSAVIDFEFRYSTASIFAPASGTTFEPADLVSFIGIPVSTSSINMEWFREDGINPPVSIGLDSNPAPQLLPAGRHTIRYVGTDSANVCSSATIQVLVNSEPVMDFTPGEDSTFFVGRPLTLVGSGTSHAGMAIATSTMKWYVNGVFKNSSSPATFIAGSLATGINTIRLVGTDEFGTVGSISHDIYYGTALSSISAPASGTQYQTINNINFSAVPATDLPVIDPQWLRNGVNFGSGPAANIVNLTVGNHVITYLATDSSNFCSSATIQILVNDPPVLKFTPGEDSFFFTGRPVTFTGAGTSTAGLSVATATMKWYLNGSTTAIKTGSPVTFNALQLPVGVNTIKMTAVDEFGTAGEITYNNIRYGIQTSAITYPASGTSLPVATLASFTGQPAPILPDFDTMWYHAAGPGAPANLGAGDSIVNIPLAAGWHTIRYLATDSSGFLSSSTIQILKNDAPVLTVSPASDSVFFANRPVTLTGLGTDSVGVALLPATMKWYVNGGTTPLKTGSPAVFAVGQLSVGNNVIRLTGTDVFGTTGEVLCNITYGYPAATISAPASGTSQPLGSLVNFAGSPSSDGFDLVMEWWRNDGLGDVAKMGEDSSLLGIAVPAGRHTITYLGTDSANFCSSATVQILMDNPPTVSFTPSADGFSDALIFTGQSFVLTGTGNAAIPPNPLINASTFKWYRDASTSVWKSSSPVTVNAGDLTTGWHDIYAVGADQYGIQGTATHKIYYGHPLASIVSPASGTSQARGSTVNFTGSIASFTMQWFLNGAATGIYGQTYSAALPDGWNTVSYLGTDSANNISSSTVMILMNDSPTVSFTPSADGVSDAIIFVGRSFVLTGTGNASIPPNPLINVSTFKWYRDVLTSVWKTSSPVTVNVGDLTTGWHDIYAEGADQYGTHGTATHRVYYGHPSALIESPASGTSQARGSTVNFTGSLSSFTMQWYLNGAATGIYGQAYSAALPDGWNTVSYLGTDSANNISSSSVMILMDDQPTMSYTPGAGSRYFTGTTVSLTGVGVGSVGAFSVPTSSMNWYLDGGGISRTNSPAVYTPGQLSVGTRSIKLEGTDQFGIVGSITHSFYYGQPLSSITSPASGTRFAIGASVSLTGTPDTTAPITMYWYPNSGLPGTQIGNGGSLSYNFMTRGNQTVTYLGTDSAGIISSNSIQILINNPPTMTIADPASAGKYFGGQSINFSGSGLNSAAGAIAVASLSWYRDDVLWKSATAAFVGTVTDLPTGTHLIRLEGKDEFGTVSSVTHSITTGLALPLISSPASGTRFDTGSSVVFTGTADLTGNMEWLWVEGATVFGNGPSASIATFTRGWQTITYRGTDSQGTLRSNTIQVLIDKLPHFDPPGGIASPAWVSSPAKFANGPQYGLPGNNIPIYLASAGTQVVFNVIARNELNVLIPPASITWYEGASLRATAATYTVNFETPGSYTYTIMLEDDFNQVSSAPFTFWVWDTETYQSGLDGPTAITNSGDTAVYVASPGPTTQSIYKLTRITSGLTTAGDITAIAAQTDVASMTHPFVDMAVSGGTIFSLGADVGVDYRIQTWDVNSLFSQATDYTKLHGALSDQFINAQGITVDTNAIYISDNGNNKVKKLDITNGNFYSQSQTVLNPCGIRYVNATNLFVAETGQNQLLKFSSDLNSVATWDSQTANNATHFAHSATTGNLYVTDPTPGAPKINVVASSGLILYSFGKDGTNPNQGEFETPWGIVIVGLDIYVTDKTGDCIVRFRTGGW